MTRFHTQDSARPSVGVKPTPFCRRQTSGLMREVGGCLCKKHGLKNNKRCVS